MQIIAAAAPGNEIDSTGDGVPDDIKAALQAAGIDFPLAGPAVTAQELPVKKMVIMLNFTKQGQDSIVLTGKLPVPASFKPAGQKVLLDVGGVIRVFTLDKNAAGYLNKDHLKIMMTRRGSKLPQMAVPAQMATFTMTLPCGSFAPTLAVDGLLKTPVSSSQCLVNVTVIINQTMYQKAVNMLYSNRLGKAGKAQGVIGVYTR